MPYLTLNGYSVGAAELTERTDNLKTEARAINGRMYSDIRYKKRQWQVRCAIRDRYYYTEFLIRLIEGDGQVFPFDLSLNSSKGFIPNTPANGSIGSSSPAPKFGTGRLGTSGAFTYTFGGFTEWTVSVWVWTGSAWQLRQQTSEGDKWQDGIKGSYGWTYALSGGVLTLPTSGFYDDLVVLPYVPPDDVIEGWPTDRAWSQLPALNLNGDALDNRDVSVKLLGQVETEYIPGTTSVTARLSFTLGEV